MMAYCEKEIESSSLYYIDIKVCMSEKQNSCGMTLANRHKSKQRSYLVSSVNCTVLLGYSELLKATLVLKTI